MNAPATGGGSSPGSSGAADPLAPRAGGPAVGGRVGAIDIGTNSVLLLVAEESSSGALVAIREEATITRLGQGVDKTRRLAPEATERTLACLATYAGILRELGVTKIDAVGTSAMRDAEGGGAFADRAAELLGKRPRVISGDEEARLTFSGGLSGLDASLRTAPVAVFDIGGGSTEFIRGEGGVVESGVSLDVGSVRLTERHLRGDPPTEAEWAACAADIDAILADAPPLRGRPLVGIAGTVTTLAAMALDVDPYDGARVHGARVRVDDVERIARTLASAPLAQRKNMRGLSPNRADVIAAGAELCRRILLIAGAEEMIASDRGVRWGLAEALR